MKGGVKTYWLIGANGFVGSYLLAELSQQGKSVEFSTYPERLAGASRLDLTNEKAVNEWADGWQRGDVVINAAAQANVEWCEAEPKETRQVNVGGNQRLVKAARKQGARYIYFSSEYVFDGLNGPYSEEDRAQPINEYGKQKSEAEAEINRELKDALIIRTTTVYGYEAAGKNFLMSLTKKMRSGETSQVPNDQVSTPTYVKDLARATIFLAEQKPALTICHVTGGELMSRTSLAWLIAREFGYRERLIEPVATAELGQIASRPLRAGLKNGRLLTAGFKPHKVKESLAEIHDEYGQYFR